MEVAPDMKCMRISLTFVHLFVISQYIMHYHGDNVQKWV